MLEAIVFLCYTEITKGGFSMTRKVYTINEIKGIVAPIAKKHGVNKVYLFGSYARGEATPSSDVDLCVDAPALRGLFALGALYADFEEALGKGRDMVTANTLGKETNIVFTENLRKDQVLIYELAQ